MEEQIISAGGFVLVGGASRRMGQDKALLPLNGRPLLHRTIRLLRPSVAEVALIGPTARYAGFGVPVIEDAVPRRGPLSALCAGLKRTAHPWNLFLACDLPLLEEGFLRFLVQEAFASSAQAVVPRTSDGWQPLCAAYRRECLPEMERLLSERDAGIVEALEMLQVEALTPERIRQAGFSERIFRNINTPADWEEIRSAWR